MCCVILKHAYPILTKESPDKWPVEGNMTGSKVVVRVLLCHYWKKGMNAFAVARVICNVEGTVDDNSARRWFQRFRYGDSDIKDKPRSGRTSTTIDEALGQAVEDKSQYQCSALLSPAGQFSKCWKLWTIFWRVKWHRYVPPARHLLYYAA